MELEMETVVRMRAVRRSFGPRIALDGFQLEVRAGRVLGLLGINGGGKSTALAIMAGLLEADSGRVEVLGADPWRLRDEERRRIGYLSEGYFPFPELDLQGAVAFVSRFHPTWDGDYAGRLMELLGIPSTLPYGALSRGQQRKFHLLLTLAPRPPLLLLDDPAQGLDVVVRRELIQALQPLLEEGDSTVIFTSHDFTEIERLADSIAIVHAGRVLLDADLDELKERAVEVSLPSADLPPLRGALPIGRQPRCTSLLLDPDPEELAALRRSQSDLVERPVTLEEIFIALVGPKARRRA